MALKDSAAATAVQMTFINHALGIALTAFVTMIIMKGVCVYVPSFFPCYIELNCSIICICVDSVMMG